MARNKKKTTYASEQELSDDLFKLVRSEEEVIYDEAKAGKRRGYYADVWKRFSKNIGALISFIILAILVFFTIFGPMMNKHSREVYQPRLEYMPPKIKGFENAKIFNGRRVVPRQKLENIIEQIDYDGNYKLRDELLFDFNDGKSPKPHKVIYNIYLSDNAVVDPNFANVRLHIGNKVYHYQKDSVVDIDVDFYKWNHFIYTYYYYDHLTFDSPWISNDAKYELLSQEGPDNAAAIENKGKLKLVGEAEYNEIKKIEEELFKDFGADFTDKRMISNKIILEEFIPPKSEKDENNRYLRLNQDNYIRKVLKIDNSAYLFGTDENGRDFFTIIWHASRTSLLLAISVSLINIIIGIIIGAISGYYGGTVDLVIERISEIIAGIPFMALLTLLLLRAGKTTFGIIILAFTLTGWLGIASLTRAQFYRYKNREYVLAARTMGASDVRIMRKHIFPSAVGTLITSLVLYIPALIFTESTYSFLGIINYEKLESMGNLLSIGQDKMSLYPYLLIFPAIYISILMISFNLMGNGLRDAFNPTLRGTE